VKYENILTICPFCGAGCNFYLQVLDGEIVGVLPYKLHTVSQGKLCIKGWNAHEFVYSKDRLVKPLIKQEDGTFKETSWDEALNIIVKKFKEYMKENGPDSIGVLSSANAQMKRIIS